MPLFLLSLTVRTARAQVVNSVLLQWRAQAEKCEEPRQGDGLAMLHVAMFEAINSIVGKYTPYIARISAPPGSSVEAAASSAAHDIEIQVCPDMKSAFDAALKTSLALVTDSVARENGVSVGRQAAAAILAARAGSKADLRDPYFAATTAGTYVPTLQQVGMTWSLQKPWVMKAPDELRPPKPPALTSAKWARDYNELKRIGGKTSKARTVEQTDIAKFWAGRSVRIVLPQLVGMPGRSVVDDARFLALAEMAWADSFVAMMDGKYAYNFWRPVTAIRGAVMDSNDSTAADSTWEPLIRTPPHPEYPCGHCMSAAAVGTVVALEFGDRPPAIVLEEKDAMLRRYSKPQEYIDEVAEARVIGGIHYRNSADVGKAMGVSIGKLAVERYFKPQRSSKPRDR